MRTIGVMIVIMRRFFSFWWLCVRTAFWGNAAFANDWQWLVGYPITAASLWILGYFYAELSGRIEVTLATGALGALAAAFVAYIVTWAASFIARLCNSPVILFHEQKDRADKLEGLRQLANGVSRAPSFDLGFELSGIDIAAIETFHGALFKTQEICRVWVENLANHPIVDCNIVIEDFSPDSPIKNGVMLMPDNRGGDEQQSAQFHLAATQRRYFKFLRLTNDVHGELKVTVKSDQDRTGFIGAFDSAELEFGKRYFTTIAVHGQNASSRRISLAIDVISEEKIVVADALSPQQIEFGTAQ